MLGRTLLWSHHCQIDDSSESGYRVPRAPWVCVPHASAPRLRNSAMTLNAPCSLSMLNRTEVEAIIVLIERDQMAVAAINDPLGDNTKIGRFIPDTWAGGVRNLKLLV